MQPLPPIDQWPWVKVDYVKEFGLQKLTVEEIASMKDRFSLDENLTKRYLTKKVGYNPEDPSQFSKAMDIYEEFGILKKDLKTFTYLCLMSQSVMPSELQACFNKAIGEEKRLNYNGFL